VPISTALPSPSIEFYGSFRYPTLLVNTQVLTDCVIGNTFCRRHPATGQGAKTVGPIIGSGGGGVVGPRFSALGGRPGAFTTTVGIPAAAGFAVDLWQTGYDAADFNEGSLYSPDSVVAIWDFHVATSSAVFAGTADQTGFWFVPLIPLQTSFPDSTPGGAGPTGGFGICLNDDGGGANQWEYISYDAGGPVTQRVAIGAAIIPDVTLWSSFRFTIVGAAAGRPAEVSLEVNRASIAGVQGVPFDDVVLFRPNTLNALASRFCVGQVFSGLAGAGIQFGVYARFGRFTAGGEEIQGV